MIDEFLSDREQEERLRNWWRENWRWVISGIVLGLALLWGWRSWEAHRIAQAEQASQLYVELVNALSTRDMSTAESRLSTLNEGFASSPYVEQGRLAIARAKIESGELDAAAALLAEVAAAARDDELKQIASLRLARLLIEQGKVDEALARLPQGNEGSYQAMVEEIRGDALYAKGDREGARAAYAAALAASREQPSADRELLELKLAEVGGPLEQGLAGDVSQ